MFITLEGGDGAGKSTLVQQLVPYWARRNLHVVNTREPGGSIVGELVRPIILERSMSVLAETYLFAAARAEHCASIIIPHLLLQHWVVCDRFAASTYVYQQCEKSAPVEAVAAIDRSISDLFATHGLPVTPRVMQLEIVLDVPYEFAFQRLAARRPRDINQYDSLDPDIFNTRRANYLHYASQYTNAVVIDGSRSPGEVLEATIAAIEAFERPPVVTSTASGFIGA